MEVLVAIDQFSDRDLSDKNVDDVKSDFSILYHGTACETCEFFYR